MMRKHLVGYLIFILLCLCVSVAVAEGGEINGIIWDLEDGVLILSGQGEMIYEGAYPWTLDSNMLNLQSAIIQDGITNIDDGAFHHCVNLSSVSIPGSVTSIGKYAFYECSNLTTITIPESVNSIGEGAFTRCTKLQAVTIPYGITIINNSTFNGCSKLTQISIPDSVTIFGDGAFAGCTELTEIEIPQNVTYLGNDVFSGCVCLSSVEIPNRVTYIGSYAFASCESLSSVLIPTGVSFVGEYAFDSCLAKRYANICSDGAKALSRSDYSFQEPGSEFQLIYLFADDIISDLALVGIDGECADFLVPDGVTRIHDWAFVYRNDIISVTLSDTVTSIGRNAFFGCDNLARVINTDNLISIGGWAFANCSSLAEINIPQSITYIDEITFSHCISLTTISIPQGVVSIGKQAFSCCEGLTSIIIPDTVTNIGEDAFSGCYYIESVVYWGNEEQWNSIQIANGNTELTSSNIKFTHVKLSVQDETLINGYCTYTANATGASEAYIGYKYSDEEEWTEFLISESFPVTKGISVKRLGMFQIRIRARFGTVWESAEAYTNVISVGTLPMPQIDGIEDSYYIGDIIELVIHEVSKAEVYSLEVLRKIEDDDDYFLCMNLYIQPSEFSGGEYQWSLDTSPWEPGQYTIRIHATAEGYLYETNWNDYILQHVHSVIIDPAIEPTDTVTGKTEGMHCSECGEILQFQVEIPALSELEILYLPSSLINIDDEAFYHLDCQGIVIPNGCISVGEKAFAYCNKLLYVSIPSSVKTIADNAFEGCDKVTIFIGE